MDKQKKRERFLRDPLPIRLGGIAANLGRVDAFANNPQNGDIVARMIDESKSFCEWAGLDATATELKTAHTLLVVQRQLVRWEQHFDAIYADPVRRAEMAETARAWSDRLLQMSGLLTTGIPRATQSSNL
ncbi:MAG: hypothetical protein ABI874_09155 [Chloroflexota bacterium]